MLIIFTSTVFPQLSINGTTTRQFDNEVVTFTFTGTLDTLTQAYDSLATDKISMVEFDSSDIWTLYYRFTSATGSPKALIDIYYSEDASTWTLKEQLVDTTTSETPAWGLIDLDGPIPEYARLVIEQVAAGRDATTFAAVLRIRKQ